jgi:hypothetical protein
MNRPRPDSPVIELAEQIAVLLGEGWQAPSPSPCPTSTCEIGNGAGGMLIRLHLSPAGAITASGIARHPGGWYGEVDAGFTVRRNWTVQIIAQRIANEILPVFADQLAAAMTEWRREQARRDAELQYAHRLTALRDPLGVEVTGGRLDTAGVHWCRGALRKYGRLQEHPHLEAQVHADPYSDGEYFITVTVTAVTEQQLGAILDVMGLPDIRDERGDTPEAI